MIDIFFIHSSADKPWVRELRAALSPELEVYIDEEDRGAGSFGRRIEDALSQTRLFVVVVSPNVRQSRYVYDEIARAVKIQERDAVRRDLVSVALGDIEWSPETAPLGTFAAPRLDCRTRADVPGIASELARRVRELQVAPAPARSSAIDLYRAPTFVDALERPAAEGQILDAMRSSNVVVVEGISGVGKSYAMSRAAAAASEPVIWYELRAGETLDEMLDDLADLIAFRSLPSRSRCRELARYLRERSTYLVVDGHEGRGSWDVLVDELAAVGGPPASLVLLMKQQALTRSRPGVTTVRVGGVDRSDLASFLRGRGLSGHLLDQVDTDALFRATDGLPLALAVFCAVITAYNVAPSQLLSGGLGNVDRLADWLDGLLGRLDESSRRLGQYLAVVDRPFNEGVVRRAGGPLGIGQVEVSFASLKQQYLAEAISPYRWRMHALVIQQFQRQLDETALRKLHVVAADDCLRDLGSGSPKITNGAEFVDVCNAIRHLQVVGRWRRAHDLIDRATPFAKAAGAYGSIVPLLETQVSNDDERTGWIDYHLAHCLLITGRIGRAQDVLSTAENPQGPAHLALSLTRLHAEILSDMGHHHEARQLLEGALEDRRLHRRSRGVERAVRQARTALAGLLSLCGDQDGAMELAQRCLAEAQRSKDPLAAAVASCRMGSCWEAKDDPITAETSFRIAFELFSEVNDLRGIGWSLTHRAGALLACNRGAEARDALQRALPLQAARGECSLDYLSTLGRIAADDPTGDLERLVQPEVRRIVATREDAER